jgi:hypothetical protein
MRLGGGNAKTNNPPLSAKTACIIFLEIAGIKIW